MREIEIDIHSKLYKMYRNSLSRWEYPPTTAKLHSFILAVVVQCIKESKEFLIPIGGMCFGFIILSIFLHLFNILSAVPNISSHIGDIVHVFLMSTLAALAIVFGTKTVYKSMFRVICTLIEIIKTALEIPTIKFTGYPQSMYEIERFPE